MKKSAGIVFSAVMLAAIASCRQHDQWVNGNDETGRLRDTTVNNGHYRYYHGAWFPIVGGMISPATYRGGTGGEIASPGYRPVRSGGFGRSARSSAGG